MNRREFLGGAATAVIGVSVCAAPYVLAEAKPGAADGPANLPKPVPMMGHGMGAYRGHLVYNSEPVYYEMTYENRVCHRSISFPRLCAIVILFERGDVTLGGFNVSDETAQTLSQGDLPADFIEAFNKDMVDGDNLTDIPLLDWYSVHGDRLEKPRVIKFKLYSLGLSSLKNKGEKANG